jgi:Arc/MetJ family transcription regulator
MRTTITLDDALVKRAKELTGIEETPTLLRTALTALVQREAGRRLAALGGTMPDIQAVRRRRPDDPE